MAILLHFGAAGQTIQRTINWDKVEKTYTNTKGAKVKTLSFPGAEASEKDGFQPHYRENIRVSEYGDITMSLSDEVYETVTSTDIKTDKIASSIQINAIPGMMRKAPYAIVSFVPIRKNPMTGHIERLVKFSLKIDKIEARDDHKSKRKQSYSNNSVLSAGSWYKVGVTTTGIYKLDYNYLKNTCGFDLANTSFSAIAVFGNGGGMVPDLNSLPRYDDLQENPTYIVDNNGNNKVDQGDYILFYAQGPDQWNYDSTNAGFDFTKNLYSDTNYYFITSSQGSGKRIQAISSSSGANQTISQFDDYAAHEDDQFNFLSSGKLWFGDMMNSLSPTYSANFSFPNLITSSPIRYSSTAVASSLYNSSIAVTLNNSQQLFSHNISGTDLNDDYPNIYLQDTKTSSFLSSSGTFSLTYTFSNPDQTGSSVGYIYNIILNAKRALTFTGSSMLFRSIASIGAGKISQFNLSSATSTTHIWDVSDFTAIQEITPSSNSGTLSFTVPTPSLREFAAVDVSASLPNPIGISSIGNQNLHAVGQPNMLIITPDDMLNPSNDLAAFHSQYDHLTVKVATLSQIYNEFGSGRLDISAIRDFVRMVYDRAPDTAHLPRYVLLMGDGSFDPKNRISDNNNQMPTYQSPQSQNITDSYTTDDFFGCLDPTEGGDMGNAYLMDLAVGRLPAASTSEAQGMVDKIRLYKSSATLASWRNIVTFVSDEPWDDRGGGSGGDEFEGDADGIANLVMSNDPLYNVSKIYCDAYQLVSTPGGGRYPDVNTAILNQINTGTLLISYTGHGGTSNWANARIFNLSDIQNLQNHEKLPCFVTATCEFSRFDDPGLKSAGEYLITNPIGGASAMVTTVRPVYEGPNVSLQTAFYTYAFIPYQGRVPTVGEVLLQTKNNLCNSDPGITGNTRMFVLLGDPAMTLDYPQYNVVTTKVDNVPITQPHDTLKALKYITISGEVRDWTGAKMTSFNGTCFPLIYDKLGQYLTLANYPGYENFPYAAYKSNLFKGQCSVINGAFTFSFIVPKDINYAIGNGRISYYADNGITDAGGYQNTNIIIGGSSDSAITSKVGPSIKLFMNDDKFVYGGITDANPKLLAELSDPYGINTTGNGLGHDLTCVLDANTQNPIVLNNYYQSALNNFRQGTVLYPFTNLSTGSHTLKMKAWDILDNSSEDNTEFIVASSAKLALQHVFNYPNPFTTNTQFMFEHNRPGEELNIMIQIFTVSGKLIKTIHQELVSTGYRVDNIRWDGLDDYGDKIGKGVYVYKVNVQDAQGGSANQFQKLVVLR
jgi:hypothetical protein